MQHHHHPLANRTLFDRGRRHLPANALRFPSADCGSQLVEYALLAPVLLTVLFAIADFGLLFQAYEVVSNAAREGARMGVMACDDGSANCYSAVDIRNRVQAFVNAGLPASHGPATPTAACITVSLGSGRPSYVAERVTVRYLHTFRFIGPVARLVGGRFSTVEMQVQSTMRRENQSSCT